MFKLEEKNYNKAFIVCLIALTALLSVFNRNIPFVYDDPGQIVTNENIREIFNFHNYLTDPLRPNRLIQNFSFAINWSISGLGEWSYHVFNNLLHLLNTLLLLFFLPKIGVKNKFLAYMTCLVFFIHPLQVEGVTYVMARVELMKTFSTFLLLHLYLEPKRKKYLIWTILSISLLIKETCALTPFLFIGLDLTVLAADERKGSIKEHLFYFSHVLWTIPLSLIIPGHAYNGTTGFALFPFFQYALTSFHYFTFYIWLFLNPSEQSLYHEWTEKPPVISVALGIILYIGMGYFIIRKRKFNPAESFMMILFLISFLPNNSILQFINPFAEYRLYQSTIVLSYFLVFFICALKINFNLKKVITAFFIVYFVFFHYLYLSIWRKPLNLWGYVLQSYPDSYMAHAGIGWAYLGEGMCVHALIHLHKACDNRRLTVYQNNCDYSLGITHALTGEKEKGFEYLHKVYTRPEYQKHYRAYETYLKLAEALKKRDEYENMLTEAKKNWPGKFEKYQYNPNGNFDLLNYPCINKESENSLLENTESDFKKSN